MQTVTDVPPKAQAEPTRTNDHGRIRPADAWVLLYEQLAAQIARKDRRKAFRLAWRFVRSPIATLRWLGELERIRVICGLEKLPYDVVRKSGQNYLHHSLPQAAKHNLLTTHYDHLLATLGAPFVASVLREQPTVLVELKGKQDALYRISLSLNFLNFREGELSIDLFRVEGNVRVTSLSLVAGALAPGAPANLWIGGIQGASRVDSKAVTVLATKELFGLRPKDAVVHAAYALAERLGTADLLAISNAGHFRHGLWQKKSGWYADYDSFWEELGGVRVAGDFFLLPKIRPRRSIEEVAPPKRSAWRARYALVDQINADIQRLAR
ncbi:hypothetical protein GCM10010909_34220 [Acidocella aquatica]|uniref:DUF535 domain-containing protein n=1 Tax=Acidocella aquatica TaxID=1922313 RepID=A0ABQ6A8D2_9PROT|nr:DUF535 family protein [Acidocella aquatica]GLR68740.1 hypothetical protein GCM10010909_34220 [Acidocella aquatica]